MRATHIPLRVCIDARMPHGIYGGVEQLVLGLASAFSRLRDGDEEYLFLTYDGQDNWLGPALSGSCRVLHAQMPRTEPFLSRAVNVAASLARRWALLGERSKVVVPPSDGTAERAGADVVHFTYQAGFRTSIPSIYHPHDLQHVHLPQFFSKAEIRWREITYRTLCEQAAMVAVASSWVKRDVVEHLRIPEEKVRVVPLAPIAEQYREPDARTLRSTREKFRLPDLFALYPAQTWPHKNHVGLLEALAGVRQRHGVTIPLVCTGRLTEFAPTIRQEARRLGLEESLALTGFVSGDELQAMYKLARAIVIPSLFEAASFPLWEAFKSGVPAACSNVTSLPEQAGDAALVFDPRDRDRMAAAIWSLWTDDDVRARLVERGRANVARYTWDATARAFRAHYRRLGGRPLAACEVEMLSANPLL